MRATYRVANDGHNIMGVATASEVRTCRRPRAPSDPPFATFPVAFSSGSSDFQPKNTASEPTVVVLLDRLQAPQKFELTRKRAPADCLYRALAC